MPEFKVGQVLNFKYYDGFQKLESYGNLFHYGQRGYTHSAIVGHVDEKGVYIYEALGEGITGSYYELWWLNAQFENGVLAIGTPIYDVLGIESLCEKHIGEKYAWLDLWDMAVYWFTGRTNVKKAENEWICSEFVCEMLRQANNKIDIVKELNLPGDDYCSPMDLSISNLISWVHN